MSSIGNSSTFDKHTNTQPLLIEGFLYLLHDVILVLPDTMTHQVLSQVVKVEVLLVMANHSSDKVRTAIIKVRRRDSLDKT